MSAIPTWVSKGGDPESPQRGRWDEAREVLLSENPPSLWPASVMAVLSEIAANDDEIPTGAAILRRVFDDEDADEDAA